jgi:hypothetical protein
LEELLLLFFQIVGDILFQALLEILCEFVFAAFKAAFDRPTHAPALAAFGLFLVGSLVGGLSLLIWPDRFLPTSPIPGISLLIAPLAVGLIMHAWGRFRRSRGRVTTNLASVAGGAAFAFGTALVRFVWVS